MEQFPRTYQESRPPEAPPGTWSIDTVYEQVPGKPYRFKEHITYDNLKAALARAKVLKEHDALQSYHIYDPEGNLWGGWWRDSCWLI